MTETKAEKIIRLLKEFLATADSEGAHELWYEINDQFRYQAGDRVST